MFTKAIVRRPGRSISEGITSAPELGKPDYERALRQHVSYAAALGMCGLEVNILPALEEYPDSCFVEDAAVVTRFGAIVDNPGAPTRKGEALAMLPTLELYFDESRIARIEDPGTLEGGDVMMVEDHFYVGRSARTNPEGIRQFIERLEAWGLTGEEVPLQKVLHLKTGVNYIGDDTLLVAGEFVDNTVFERFRKIVVPEAEAYAANSLRVNDYVLVPAGYPQTLAAIEAAGFKTICVDTSEFRKVDGGLSCLSLRF